MLILVLVCLINSTDCFLCVLLFFLWRCLPLCKTFFYIVNVVFPVQPPAPTNSSSSEDEVQRSSSTVVRRRRLRKSTANTVTDPEEEEAVLESHLSDDDDDDDEEEEEQEVKEQQKQQDEPTEVRSVAASDARQKGRGGSIIKTCIFLVLLIVACLCFGHLCGKKFSFNEISVNALGPHVGQPVLFPLQQ